jgi:5-methylcytosine-specific restriction endonuclease McrA
MQWFKIDSLLAEHPKWMSLDDPEAKLLWVMVGVGCSRIESDGVIRPPMFKKWAFDAGLMPGQKLTRKVRKIVEVGLWHDATTFAACDECVSEFPDGLASGELVMHNFNDWNPNKADKANESSAWKANRRRRLGKLKKLKQEIYLRDRDYCRYCGIRVNMNDRISTEGGCLDHVDPDGENTLENLVRCCRGCNIYRKGERTPQEAGMRLLPPPERGVAPHVPAWRRLADPFGVDDKAPKYPASDFDDDPTPDPTPDQRLDPTPTNDQDPENQWSDLSPASRDVRLGPEPDRSRVEPVVGTGSESARPGAARAGLGLTGAVRVGAERPGPGLGGAGLLGAGAAPTTRPEVPATTSEANR